MWLRCQFHAHTTNSDGEPLPVVLCDHYADLGFDVLAITDHWHVTDVEHDRIVVMPSSELTANAPTAHDEAEVLALGVAKLPAVSEPFPNIEALAAWIVDAGRCSVPLSSLLERPSGRGRARGTVPCRARDLERRLRGDAGQRPRDGAVGRRAPARADGDGPRDRRLPHAGRGQRPRLDLGAARERSAAATIEALRHGRFYASAGPKLRDVVIEETTVTVRCSPARSVRLRSGPWDGCAVNAELGMGNWRGDVRQRDGDGLITVARFEFPEFWRWARVEVEDERGRRAWSNSFVLPGELPARV